MLGATLPPAPAHARDRNRNRDLEKDHRDQREELHSGTSRLLGASRFRAAVLPPF